MEIILAIITGVALGAIAGFIFARSKNKELQKA